MLIEGIIDLQYVLPNASVASLFDQKEYLVAWRTFCYCTVTQSLYFDFVFLQLKLIDET